VINIALRERKQFATSLIQNCLNFQQSRNAWENPENLKIPRISSRRKSTRESSLSRAHAHIPGNISVAKKRWSYSAERNRETFFCEPSSNFFHASTARCDASGVQIKSHKYQLFQRVVWESLSRSRCRIITVLPDERRSRVQLRESSFPVVPRLTDVSHPFLSFIE